MSLTNKAAEQIKLMLAQRKKGSLGIRIAIKQGGCSGFKYAMEYADEQRQFEESLNEKGVRILIDPKALMYLIGTQMDYKEDAFKSGFIFTNPNEKAKCGCGNSFNV